MAYDVELLQQIMDNTDAMVYLKDEDGRFLMVNRRTADMMKKTVGEFVGKTDYDFLQKEQADRFREFDRKVAETGAPLNYRDTVAFPSGRFTIIDHKFPVSLAGHKHAIGGIAIEVKET